MVLLWNARAQMGSLTHLQTGPAAMHVEETGFAGTGNSYKPEKRTVPCGPEADKPEV